MPRRSTETSQQLRRRTELAIQLAYKWMEALRSSQRGLARRLGTDQSVLSRFLSQQPGFEPAPGRPRLMKLLERIEGTCSHIESVEYFTDAGSKAVDDFEAVFQAHVVRLRTLRQQYGSADGLARMGELSGIARCLPMPYRPYACNNTLLAISILIHGDDGQCSEELLRATLQRVRELEQTAIPAIDELDVGTREKGEEYARAAGYSGVSRAYSGLRLEDDALVSTGVEQALAATKHLYGPQGEIWHNALALLERLLSAGHPEAVAWSERAAKMAEKDRSEALRAGLVDRNLEHLLVHWRKCVPGLVEEILGASE